MRTTPSRANDCPLYTDTALEPLRRDPPWIKTMTGKPCADGSGVHTFRFRQSSPGISGSGSSDAKASLYGPFGAVGPYSTASRTPDHGGTGAGGANLFGPKGAAAYGRPRNRNTP